MNVVNLFFGFQGRINRATWWLCGAVLFALGMVLDVAFFSLLAQAMPGANVTDVAAMAAGLRALLLLYPSIAVGVKRLHDRNKSGWWIVAFVLPAILLMLLLPVAFAAGTAMSGGLAFMIVAVIAATVMMLFWNLIELGFLSGNAGDNDYGRPTRFADLLGGGEQRESTWANAIDVSASTLTSQENTAATQAAATSNIPHKPVRDIQQRPQGFGRRPQPAR